MGETILYTHSKCIVYTIYFETLCRVLFPKKIGLVADYVHILDYRLITFIFWMSG